MKRLLKIDLYRAFCGPGFIGAFLFGIILGIMNIYQYVWPASVQNDLVLATGQFKNIPPVNVFIKWLGVNPRGMEQFLYYIVLPLIAVVPYASSYFEDKKSGFLKNCMIRVPKKAYFTSRCIAIFLSGGCAFALPLLINFACASLFLPSLVPDPYYSSINENSMWNHIYYSFPQIYTLLYIGLDFLFSGLIAVISLTVSDCVEHKFTVVLFPFLVYLAVFSLGTFISTNSEMLAIIPVYFLSPSFPYANSKITFVEIIILAGLAILTVLLKGKTSDTLD